MSRRAALAAALLLCACGTSQWVREDRNAQETDTDIVDCTRHAQRQADLRAAGFSGPGYGPFVDRFGRPIGSPGPLYDPAGNRALDEAGLTDACMRAKGYRREPAR